MARALLSVMVMACLLGCRGEEHARGITLLLESVPDSLDDRMALSTNGERLAQLIAPGLVTFDDAARPSADLAASWEEVSPTELRFTLRPNLTFHDGSALTSEDVKATLEGVRLRKIPSPKADKLEAISAIDAPDPSHVVIHLRHPYAPLLAELSIGIVPRARAGEVELQGARPIGAGPFRLVAHPDDEHLELAPFAGYYAGAPKVSALHVRVVPDETTRVLELLRGKADLVVNAVSPAVLGVFAGKPHLEVLSAPGTGYAYVGFNVRKGPLADVRVRRAICHLIRPDELLDYKLHHLAVGATGMLPKGHWAYTPTEGCRYDPKEAARLLDEAGYPDPDGPGPKMRLRLSYKTSTDRFRKSIALVLAEQLREGGIDVDLRALEFGTFFGDVRKGNFEVITLKWAAIIEPDLLRWVFDSKFVPTEQNHFGGLNRAGYKNPELDELVEKAAEAPQAERAALYGKAQRILDRDLPNLPLWHESAVAVVSDRLVGFRPSPHGFLRPLAFAEEAR